MKFFRKTEFCNHLYDNFGLEKGFIQIMKGEEVGPEQDAYLFTYGHPYTRTGKTVDFKGTAGTYVLFSYHHLAAEKEVIESLEKWYGQKIQEYCDKYEFNGGIDILVRVSDPKYGFWWSKD